MTEKNHDKELDALKADIARLREEIAGLAAGVKESAGIHDEQAATHRPNRKALVYGRTFCTSSTHRRSRVKKSSGTFRLK